MNLNLILNLLNLGFLQAPSISDKLYVISSLTKLLLIILILRMLPNKK